MASLPATPLQPAHRYRLLSPGVTGLHLPAIFDRAGLDMSGPAEESSHRTLLRLADVLLHPPPDMILAWDYLDGISCVWVAGGNTAGFPAGDCATALGVPVFCGGGVFAGEEGGLAMLEELELPTGMICDLGQSLLKITWHGQRHVFPRDTGLLPNGGGMGAHTLKEKSAQRRALRRFLADSIRGIVAEGACGKPQGVIFALPSVLDKWGQPFGSSYIGMRMDTQLVTDALELAGLPDIPHWLLNDAELAATSAIFDERVIACGGKALVFTLGTAMGCALADPLAAALHFYDSATAVDCAGPS